MRSLAVARLRLLTTVRVATPVFLLAAVPPVLALLFEAMPEPLFRSTAGEVLEIMARATLFAWLIHGAFLVIACEAFGNVQLMRPGATAVNGDLLDSAPIGRFPRFWGEALGVFGTTLTIHVCCLPLLATAAILSPLPTVVFVAIDATIVAALALASTGAAWKRLAVPTRWSATRTARSGIVFMILFLAAVFATTDWERFRDAVGDFLFLPSMRHWASVTSAVIRPELLAVFIAALYGGYIVYYYRSTREREGA